MNQPKPEDETGNLLVNIRVRGDGLTPEDYEDTLKITIQNENGQYLDQNGKPSDTKVEMTLKDAGFQKNADGTYSKLFKDVPIGKYTITETYTRIDGYNLKDEPSKLIDEATVEKGQTATVEIKDVYKKKPPKKKDGKKDKKNKNDSKTNKDGSTNTGDDSPLGMLILIFMTSLTAILGIVVANIRRRQTRS